jgi:pyruvate dehydrogenase E2 component (dihydrolipoamide acetyltransferase)
MAKILDMPKLSPTMEEGLLQAWHKKEGDAIEVDDLLAEVETDKATMEFRAFDRGTLLKILVMPGTAVKLGQAVAVVGNAGEDISALVARAGGGAPPPPPSPPPAAPSREAAKASDGAHGTTEVRAAEPSVTLPTATGGPVRGAGPVTRGSVLTRTERDAADLDDIVAGASAGGRVLASPYVRKVARERGIDLAGAQGSGDHGRVLPEDLDRLAARAATPPDGAPAAAPAQVSAGTALARTTLAAPGLTAPEARPLSPMRKTIARRLTQSKQTVPHFYLTIDVDAGELVALRERINADLAGAAGKGPAEDKPLKVSLNDLLIKGVAAALVRVPECNAQFTEDALLVHRRVDISVAVAIPDGLVTPVLRNADQKSVVAIAREVRDLAARARAKKLRPEEMSDGTFSISNLGMFGIDAFSAVINPPEGAILAVGQARDEPVVNNGEITAGKKMSMTLSCDHRVIDGAVGAAFLAELRALLEHPMRILTG